MQKFLFQDGLDKDIDVRMLKATQWRDAENIRITAIGGTKFIITNIKGNEEVEIELPEAFYTSIGSYDDKLGKRLFYFLHSAQNTFAAPHRVMYYNYETGVTETILFGQGLNFSLDHRIHSVALATNRYLIFTDYLNEVRSIDLNDLDKFLNRRVTATNAYQLESAKRPLQSPILVRYNTNEQFLFNNLRGRAWQFAVIATYRDGGRSPLSAYSTIAMPSSESVLYFGTNVPIQQDNEIIVTFSRPNVDVDKIELCVRGKLSDENVGQFFVTKSWNREQLDAMPSNTINYTFLNNGFERFVDNNEVLQVGNFFPKRAKGLALGFQNRLFMANTEDGMDLPTPNMTLEWEYQPVPQPNNLGNATATVELTQTPIAQTNNTTNTQPYCDLSMFDNSPTTFIFQTKEANVYGGGSTYLTTSRTIPRAFNTIPREVNINNTTPLQTNDVAILQSAPIGMNSILVSGTVALGSSIRIRITANFFQFTFTRTQSGNIVSYNVIPLTTIPREFNIEVVAKSSSMADFLREIKEVINSLNTNSGNILGNIVATEEVFNSTSGAIRIFSGISNGTDASGGNWGVSAITNIFATISNSATGGNVPPQPTFKTKRTHEFAIAYSDSKGRMTTALADAERLVASPLGVNSPNRTNRGRTTALIRVGHLAPQGATNFHILHRSATYSFVEIPVLLKRIGTTNDYEAVLESIVDISRKYSASVLKYTWERGDKVEILFKDNVAITNSEEVEIREYSTADNKIIFQQPPSFTSSFVEGIYVIRLSKATNNELTKPFSETGIILPILPNGFHVGNPTTQTANNPAVIRIDNFGDCFYRPRIYTGVRVQITPEVRYTEVTFVEDESISDFFLVTASGAGRPNVVDPNFQRRVRGTAMVFTEPFVVDSFVNGLSTVYDSSIEVFGNQHGDIQFIRDNGRSIDVYLQRRAGVVGILQANILGAGGEVVYDTTRVLNDLEFYAAEFGIGNDPESFSDYSTASYFVDRFRGVVCRKSSNGIFPISEYGMISEFQKELRDENIDLVRTTYDRVNNELLVVTRRRAFVSPFTVDFVSSNSMSLFLDKEYKVGERVYVNYTSGMRVGEITAVTEQSQGVFETLIQVARIGTENPISLYVHTFRVWTFSEPLNKWISKVTFSGEWFDEMNVGICSFKKGKLFVHDSENVPRNFFYNEQFKSKLQLIVNEQPSFPKRLKSIQEEGNAKWYVPKIVTNTPSGANRTLFQESNLTKTNLKHVSNMFVSGFYKDINTVNITNPRIEGNDLRGQYAVMDLENDDTTPVELFSVGVNYITTDISNSQ